MSENEIEALKKLTQLRLSLGDKAKALEALQLGFFINPFDASQHLMAGDLYLDQKNSKAAITEYQVALALKPANLAEAHYNLARAQFEDGDKRAARKALLQSLEIAPTYSQALDLLLKLRRN